MEDSKVEGWFTRMVSEGRGKPKVVVNIEISKDGDLCKRAEEQNLIHFATSVVKDASKLNVGAKYGLLRVPQKLAPGPEALPEFTTVSNILSMC
ncbi:hypothetical protein E2C01_001357 [Portunus trituberculatus]|uniref:Uncharacterized protein n=1 Tax=Portunus trituberculatus TaxID=210409 RepID=A0A5B7CMC6_PORTR|nr:hypothetical protein [Portunus trituberculatus]